MSRGSLKPKLDKPVILWVALIVSLLLMSLLMVYHFFRPGIIRQNLRCTIKACLYIR